MPNVDELSAVLPEGTQVVREIAHGGQRVAYEVISDGQRVCLKLMRCRDGGLERAQREVAVGYGLRHRNLVEILDPAVQRLRIADRNYCYFREEFIDGSVLTGSRMKPCAMSWAAASRARCRQPSRVGTPQPLAG